MHSNNEEVKALCLQSSTRGGGELVGVVQDRFGVLRAGDDRRQWRGEGARDRLNDEEKGPLQNSFESVKKTVSEVKL